MLGKFIGGKGSIEVADEKSLIGLRESNWGDAGPKATKLRDQLPLLKRKNKDTSFKGNTQQLSILQLDCVKLLRWFFLDHLEVRKLILRLKVIRTQDVNSGSFIQRPPQFRALHVSQHYIWMVQPRQRKRNIDLIPEIIFFSPERDWHIAKQHSKSLLMLRPRNPSHNGISFRYLQLRLHGPQILKLLVEHLDLSRRIINGDKPVIARRVNALRYSSIQMQKLISKIRPLF